MDIHCTAKKCLHNMYAASAKSMLKIVVITVQSRLKLSPALFSVDRSVSICPIPDPNLVSFITLNCHFF